jgi:Fur family zinc uptake transcriptional regulator
MNNTCDQHHDCIDSAIQKAEIVCAENKLQFTPLRRNIFKLIWQSHSPLKAYNILEQLQKDDPSAKPITVYRTLDFLLENRMIHKIESQNSYLGCTHPGEKHNCYFTICKKCNVVNEGCKSDLLNNVYNSLKQEEFLVDHVTLEIQGICSNCHKAT